MEPPAPKKAKLGAGGASKPSNKASKPKAIRGAAAEAAGEAAVRDYLERFHRPCNCTQLWENTRKIVSKSNIQLALNRLVAAGIVAEKQYQNGKVSLYYANPDAMAAKHGAPAPDELCDMVFDDVPKMLVEADALKVQALKLERRAAALGREPTNAALDAALRSAATAAADAPGAERRDAELAARVEVLASRTWVEPRQLAEAKAAHDAALAKWKTLRRVVRDVADVCAETTDDDVDVAHLAGVFTDREAGVAGPDPVPFGAA